MENNILEIILIPVVGWLCLNAFNQNRKSATINAELIVIKTQLSDLSSMVKLFLKTEVDTLKDIADRVNSEPRIKA